MSGSVTWAPKLDAEFRRNHLPVGQGDGPNSPHTDSRVIGLSRPI